MNGRVYPPPGQLTALDSKHLQSLVERTSFAVVIAALDHLVEERHENDGPDEALQKLSLLLARASNHARCFEL